MFCTLSETFVPYEEKGRVLTAASNLLKYFSTVIPVWDLDLLGWRSFRVNSILSFSESEHGELHNVEEEVERIKMQLEEAEDRRIDLEEEMLDISEDIFEKGIMRDIMRMRRG